MAVPTLREADARAEEAEAGRPKPEVEPRVLSLKKGCCRASAAEGLQGASGNVVRDKSMTGDRQQRNVP
jgi:hypothetical protein